MFFESLKIYGYMEFMEVFKFVGLAFLVLALGQRFVHVKNIHELVTYMTKRALKSQESRAFAGERTWKLSRNIGIIYVIVYGIYECFLRSLAPDLFYVDSKLGLIIGIVAAGIPQLFIYLKVESELKQTFQDESRSM